MEADINSPDTFISLMIFLFVSLGGAPRTRTPYYIDSIIFRLTLVGTLAINKYIRTGVKTCERKEKKIQVRVKNEISRDKSCSFLSFFRFTSKAHRFL